MTWVTYAAKLYLPQQYCYLYLIIALNSAKELFFHRGKGQKVVGFTFYGDVNSNQSKSRGYMEGIKENLDLMPKYYPGWIMRVYFDLDPKHPVLKDLCLLACSNDQLDICHAGKLPGTYIRDARKMFAMNWRFLPTLDPQVREAWYDYMAHHPGIIIVKP